MQPTASGAYLQADVIQVRCFRIWEENANLYFLNISVLSFATEANRLLIS